MNLRELNYILIPKSLTHSGRAFDAWETSRLARLLGPLLRVLGSVTTEGIVVFVALLISGAAGIDVRYSHLYLVFCGLFGLLMSALLLRPIARLDARLVDVWLEHSPRVIAQEALSIEVAIRNRGTRPISWIQVRLPFLPWDAQSLRPPETLSSVAPGETRHVNVSLKLQVRGARTLGRFSAGSIAPLGLATGNALRTPPLQVTVLPRVVPVVIPGGLALRPTVGGTGMGARSGESFELLGVRPYRPGDRPRDLHQRAWARHGVPMVRELRQVMVRRACVAVDLTQLGAARRRETVDAALGLAAGAISALSLGETGVELLVLGRRVLHWSSGVGRVNVELAMDLLALAEAVGEGHSGAGGAFEPPVFEEWSMLLTISVGLGPSPLDGLAHGSPGVEVIRVGVVQKVPASTIFAGMVLAEGELTGATTVILGDRT